MTAVDNERPTGNWRVIAASACGTSHQKVGMPCQDRFHWRVLPEGVLIAAVADGAGSARLAERGAEVAAREAVQRLAVAPFPPADDEEAWRALLLEAVRSACAAVEEEATRLEAPVNDLATTLIVLVVTPKLVTAAQVGDGAVVTGQSTEEAPEALTTPQGGEYVNETTFVTSPDVLHRTQLAFRRGAPSHLAAFSDGLQSLALDASQSAPHPQFFLPLFRFVTQAEETSAATDRLSEFLASPRVTRRADDDLTLLLATYTEVTPDASTALLQSTDSPA